MNFLAHFYFAYGSEDRLLGQFIADAVKGKNFARYSGGVRDGILQHRIVDHLTDIHEAPRSLRAELRAACGLLSPVAVDMLLDHSLAKKWDHFHALPLPHFAASVYATLGKSPALLPDRMRITLEYMSRYDWLSSYAHAQGLERSIRGLSTRVNGGEQLLGMLENTPFYVRLSDEILEPFMRAMATRVKDSILHSGSPFLSEEHYY